MTIRERGHPIHPAATDRRSDYPPPEGSWQLPRGDDEPPTTHLHLRDPFGPFV